MPITPRASGMSNDVPEEAKKLHVSNLVYAAQLESGACRLQLQPVHLPQLVGTSVSAARVLAAEYGVDVTSTQDAFGGTVHADPIHLQHLLMNVLAQAIESTPRGQSVDVWLARDDVRAEIRVQGGGARSEETMTLGLTIARKLAELHGGSLHITSHGAAIGSTFTVRLPLLPLGIEEPESSGPATDRCAGMRVLVVDDEADARALIAAVLTHYGATVDVAADTLHALTALSKKRYDVLVSDLSMPLDDGFNLIEQVRQSMTLNRNIPAVALTAHADARDRAIDAGFSAYVTKPVAPVALVNVIAAVGRGRKRDNAL